MHLTRPSSFSLFVKSLPFADTDECTELPLAHNCNTTAAACVNTVGSFTCVCNAGFFGDGTTDGSGCEQTNECTDSSYPHNCDTNAYCTDNYGSFTCACNNGYADNSAGTDGTSCADINECTESNPGLMDTCHPLASCTNTNGSFYCNCTLGNDDTSPQKDGTNCTSGSFKRGKEGPSREVKRVLQER
uniref:EGF-like domain-containing protein n=1 Tax=Chromera velia CCMP2878 TaxID=1169474 RepID=A0A0K6SB92_9ALVE|eukprot:Cvel_13591.t2-p1 / transcript=Cvel_13591.t2 / gene=Cvel_13591 / organism=Chromera_velia_CCMP2878 / gene_product=Fibrillin-1, putative / transcript_product=Fibrillin-1, putative / location=Cvel_scaffold935:17188-18272(-) / protein_length=187 / sequence_SO=supercontig / SO=protein_coding / is_pseudo=false